MYVYIYIHVYTHTYTHMCIHAYRHTCIHIYIYSYTHTYIHTYAYVYRMYTRYLPCELGEECTQVPRHQEALWLRQLYATYYERQLRVTGLFLMLAWSEHAARFDLPKD